VPTAELTKKAGHRRRFKELDIAAVKPTLHSASHHGRSRRGVIIVGSQHRIALRKLSVTRAAVSVFIGSIRGLA
jgi:hypothetical protein